MPGIVASNFHLTWYDFLMHTNLTLWIGFNVFVLAMLALDLGVFHRKAHAVKVREAVLWSVVWIALAGAFNVVLYFGFGGERALEFLTGYLIEKSLSIDNLFVFLIIFSYFRVPAEFQHRVLFWGVLGALVMRAAFIAGGVALIERFHWIMYIFGGFLILTGIKMSQHKDRELHPDRNPVVRLTRRFFSISSNYHGQSLFARENGRRVATPLFMVLLVIETTDLIFAVDSIPAILAISRDPFIVYTSNVFAILGLRSLYFALAGIMQMFHFIHYGLSAILVFVGSKMLLSDIYKIPIAISLGLIAAIIAVSIIASILWPQRSEI
jgi:tellurite resistance protein TerC